jgi:signal peptidase I
MEPGTSSKPPEVETPKQPKIQEEKPTKLSIAKGIVREIVELVVVTLFLLIVIRWAVGEARYIPSASMEPTLQINDRLIVEKITKHLGQPIKRGDILVFYPPPIEMGNHDLSNDPLTILGRLTGLPFLPNEPAFIKRVIGLPGEHIRVVSGQGVYVNNVLIEEPYIKEAPDYSLNTLGDIGGSNTSREQIQPYKDKMADPIIVPAGHLFMMGDNRNNSEDGHVWGFLDEKRVIGRAWVLIWRRFNPYPYSAPANE